LKCEEYSVNKLIQKHKRYLNFQFFFFFFKLCIVFADVVFLLRKAWRVQVEKVNTLRTSILPGVVIEVVGGTDCKERRCAVEVQDFVEGAHEEIGLVVGPD
jgi:hypothetical protein